jgi:hypothetical protein
MAQKILHLTTDGSGLRSKVEGWSAEDGDLIEMNKEIGLSDGMKTPFYSTVMHAIADGWKLLAPPVKSGNWYEWYLVKD